MAPEMIQKMDYNQSVDWWALGMITYEMLVSYAPFEGTSSEEAESHIRDSIVHGRVIYPDWLSREAVSFISGILKSISWQRSRFRILRLFLFRPFSERSIASTCMLGKPFQYTKA